MTGMTTHRTKYENSDILKRIISVLSDGKRHSTMDIALEAKVCAVSTHISALRGNNFDITTTREGKIYWYQLRNVRRLSWSTEQTELITQNLHPRFSP